MMQQQGSANGNGNGGIHNLSTLLKRLEAATSRLEDIALAQHSQQVIGVIPGPSALPAAAAPSQSSSTSATAAGAAGAAVPAPPPAPPAAPSAPSSAEQDSPAVTGYRDLLNGPLKSYADISNEVGDVVAEQAKMVTKAFEAQLGFVQAASKCKKVPTSDSNFMTLLKPTQEALMEVSEFKDKNRGSKLYFNCLSEVAEGIPALAWVTLDAKPGPFVSDMKDAAQFYANRVLKDHKDSNPKLVEWARSFIGLLEELRKYVLQHHATALTWNPNGVDAPTYLSSAGPGSSASGAAPGTTSSSAPPPPPSVPAAGQPSASGGTVKPKAGGGDLSAVFGDLNRGADVTKGLRKVDKSEMTHKNPNLRTSSAVPSREESGGAAASGSPSASASSSGAGRPAIPRKPASFAKKAARKELDGTKWTIENFENDREVIIDNTEISHTINVFSCKSSVIQIKGKVNAVSLVGCSKTSVLLDSTVSALSITSSPSFTVQILGVVPTILIDNTDGGQVYLSKDSLGVEVITSKTSGLNISLPDPESKEEGEFVERPVPEQMKTVVGKDGKLVTSIVEHAG